MKRYGKEWDIRLELGGTLAPPLPGGHGVTREAVGRQAEAAQRALVRLLGADAPSGFLSVVRRPSVLRQVADAARRWRRRGLHDVIHVGIGGSSLGAETLLRALLHPQHNLLGPKSRPGPRVHLVDNVDPETLGGLLEVVNLRHTLVHVVSKSGSTVETAASFQILREALERAGRGVRWNEHCVFTTGRGALRDLGRSAGVEILDFPEDVGGRFSVFTPSGLFTPAVAGADVGSVGAGGRRMLARLSTSAPHENPAAVSAAICTLLAQEHGKPIHVLMPYADALEPLGRWYVQLAGESLGKQRERQGRREGVGPTPLPARGASDQHSQVQLFIEGPADKLVTFVVAERMRRRLPIAGGPPAAYLEGVELGDLLRAEQRGTAVALSRVGRPFTSWVLPESGPHPLGQLLLALEAQVACQAELYGVNAYDQPGVEAGKVAAFALIGREGYESQRREIEADAGLAGAWTL